MINAAYYAALQREEHNRLRSYFPRQRALDLPLRRDVRRTFQFPLVTLRWRHCLELTENGNAFFIPGRAPLLGDVLEWLWRLHPYYRTAEGDYPNIPAGRRTPTLFVSWLSLLVVTWYCRKIDLSAAEFAIRSRTAEAFQDQPGPPKRKAGEAAPVTSILAPQLNRFDDVSLYFAENGWLLPDILDAGVAWTLQLYRASLIANGEWERCTSPSAALVQFEPEQPAEDSHEFHLATARPQTRRLPCRTQAVDG